MRHRLLLLAIALMAISQPLLADQPLTLSVCAKGDATVYVSSVIYDQTFLLERNSYLVAGWYTVDPGACTVVYNSNDANGNPVYVGVAYRDSNGILRSDGPRPGQNSGGPSYWEHFCVNPGGIFQYRVATKEDAQNCKPGFVLGDFEERYDPPANRYGNVDISVNPMLSDTTGRALTGIPSDSSTSPAPSTAPVAAPPPATAPSSPPASPSDDDPIGSGGFITPPDQR